MVQKPTLLFYCQHTLGLGHIARAFHLSQALLGEFRVVLLLGGPPPSGIAVPTGLEIIALPPLGLDSSAQLISLDPAFDVPQAQTLRRQIILRTHARTQPAVILTELFPFGRKKFATEILSLLDADRQRANRALLLCSLRDVLVNARHDQRQHDERAALMVNEYFDAVLVHSDPNFARLEDSFRPATPLTKPVFYTGFVTPNTAADSPARRAPRILVSAGGGAAGVPLLDAAIQAHEILWPSHGIAMTLVSGPYMPPEQRQRLRSLAQDRDGLELIDSVPGLLGELTQVSASVSQCGYNTAMDLLRSRVPALVIPYSQAGETEQTFRATRLRDLGLLRCLAADDLSGARLAQEILWLRTFEPAPVRLNLDGARGSLDEILRLRSSRRTVFA